MWSRRPCCPATSPSTPGVIAVDQHGKDHLLEVGSVILAKTVAAECRSASALEVQARSVHEDEVEPREQVAPMREQPLLDHARRKRRAAVLPLPRQFPAQPP